MSRLERQRLTGRRFRYYRSIFRFCEQDKSDPSYFWAGPLRPLLKDRGKISYLVDARTRHVLEEGVQALIGLSRLRHRQWVATSEWEGVLHTKAYGTVESMPTPNWLIGDAGSGFCAERVVVSAAAVDSWLDPGLVLAWLDPSEPGGRMLHAGGMVTFVGPSHEPALHAQGTDHLGGAGQERDDSHGAPAPSTGDSTCP